MNKLARRFGVAASLAAVTIAGTAGQALAVWRWGW